MKITKGDIAAIQRAYDDQIEFGSDENTSLALATIVFLQRHPIVPLEEAKEMIKELIIRIPKG